MNKDTVLEVKGVSQRFSRSMRHTLRYGIHDIFQQLLPSNSDGERKLRPGEFWALRDINFSLRAGESLGILGNNGAGKSTLLKLIAGIYRPTVGHIRVQGRIGAIVELGSSFSPNLSGRENIRLQALLHGYSPGLLKRKMDEILAFADLGDFIDSPVQHYSTGMRARLGFAVAVHGDPDILLVDEVLAVGDLSFQNKCLRLVEAFREQGGAVIYVGHNPFQMQAACKRGIILQRGCIQFDGSIVTAIDKILDGVAPASAMVDDQSVANHFSPKSNEHQSDVGNSQPFKVRSTAIAYHPAGPGQMHGTATIEFTVDVQRATVSLNGLAAIFNQQGHQAIAVSISDAAVLSAGLQKLTMQIPQVPLISGSYLVKICLLDEETSFSLWNKGWSDTPLQLDIPGEGSPHRKIAKSRSSKIFLDSKIRVDTSLPEINKH
jgi:ABC-type polysaccharide/polyol phosphate transport system ATPase subunit